MTQEELASAGVARRSYLEAGRYNPSLRLAWDIAKVFGVTIEDLFEYTE